MRTNAEAPAHVGPSARDNGDRVRAGNGVFADVGNLARVVEAVDKQRESLERDIHDGVQQRLVSVRAVEMRQGNLLAEALPVADVVLGNLTGALLRRAAATLSTAVARGGVLIVSGFTEDERLAIEHAFAPLAVAHAESEHGWLALTFGAPPAWADRGAASSPGSPAPRPARSRRAASAASRSTAASRGRSRRRPPPASSRPRARTARRRPRRRIHGARRRPARRARARRGSAAWRRPTPDRAAPRRAAAPRR